MRKKKTSRGKKVEPALSTVFEASIPYRDSTKGRVRGKPVKIVADFDAALDALVAVPAKKRRKAGRP